MLRSNIKYYGKLMYHQNIIEKEVLVGQNVSSPRYI